MTTNPGASADVLSVGVTAAPALPHLRDQRLRQALTQADLAEQAGVARTTIIRLEAGKPNVLPSTLRKLAKALHVKPVELLG